MTPNKSSFDKLYKFIIFNVVLITISFYAAFRIKLYTLHKNNKEPIRFLDWINQGKITLKGLTVSLLFGIVFGFLDNLFLWIGIDRMTSFIPGGTLTKGAWGNTYSDFIGATVGASIASIGESLLNVEDNPPIWINAVAMPLGCILGMMVGQSITGKT
jgi:hypothetical protein